MFEREIYAIINIECVQLGLRKPSASLVIDKENAITFKTESMRIFQKSESY